MDLSLTSELLYRAGMLTDMQSWLTAQTLWGDHKGNEIPSHEKQDSPCSSSQPFPWATTGDRAQSSLQLSRSRGIGAERHGTSRDATASSPYASWPQSHVMVASLLTNLPLFLPSYWCRIQANKLLFFKWTINCLKQKSRIYRLWNPKDQARRQALCGQRANCRVRGTS